MSTATATPRNVAALTEAVITRTHRVPALHSDLGDHPGDARDIVQRLDAVLATLGFTLSGELLDHLAGQDPIDVQTEAVALITTVRAMVGDHVTHNPYFIDFPANVPDTQAFWEACLRDALRDPKAGRGVAWDLIHTAKLNLLDLPRYGRYQHTYAQMVARHDELVAAVTDRLTVLHLGADLLTEVHALFESLATSVIPLPPQDLALVAQLAPFCPTPTELPPVRETRAVINGARLPAGWVMVCDTVTDVLRAACAASGGDPTLETPTRFRSFTRPERRALLDALNRVVGLQPTKLADIATHREPFKRLGERLHPHEYADAYPHAAEAFAVARGEKIVRSLASRVQHAFDLSDRLSALELLSRSPGMMLRNTDRLLRSVAGDDLLVPLTISSVRQSVGAASGRVLLSLREHLANRVTPGSARVFSNRKGRAWVTADDRAPLDDAAVGRVVTVLDNELHRRLPHTKHLVVDPTVYGAVLPLSGKSTPDGFGVLPRGSRAPITGDRLRFFMHWRQASTRTDYDLSVLLLDENFQRVGHLSYTLLSGFGGTHSGDIVTAPDGATEFIDLDLRKVSAPYIVPQVNVFCGEGFDDVAESMFGYMTRDGAQAGLPFEPRTVRTRSGLRGSGRVALPLVFQRVKGQWFACWTHLFLRGEPMFNRVEDNARSTSTLVAGAINRERMTVGAYLAMMGSKASNIYQFGPGWAQPLDQFGAPTALPAEPVTYVGLEAPGWLPEGSDVITLDRLHELVVA